jgi:ABC-type branched-subunit amino acid transport system ATPase component
VVALTALGGLGLFAGPLLGAFYIIGLPTFVHLDSAALAASSLGWLVLVLYCPGGLAQLVRRPRDWVIGALARRGGLDAAALAAKDDDGQAPALPRPPAALGGAGPARPSPASGEVLLRAEGLRKQYGGIVAVEGVDLEVRRGEILGIIGTNGAGKTTLFELLSGFVAADAGTVAFRGRDVSRLSASRRAELGLVRSFQDAVLFPTLTVVETVEVALERADRTRTLPSVLGLRAGERRKEQRARELVALMGLDRFRSRQVRELSTGSRRVVELACLTALEPTLLLLDEPSSGIAQRECEALGDLLLVLKERLDAAFVVIEHDIPLVMRLSDRLVAMDTGRVIAEGEPAAVRNDPDVVRSYLGGDRVAIARSGAAADLVVVAGGRCAATTRSGAQCRRRAVADELCAQHLGSLAGSAR